MAQSFKAPRLLQILAATSCLLAASPSSLACESCKSTIVYPDEPFAAWASRGSWIKFTILTADPTHVIFQDSNLYRFHYDFAANQLGPFLGMTASQFDAVSLHAAGQQVILGAVIFSPIWGVREYGIQLIRDEPYDPLLARALLQRVKSAVISSPEATAFYFPTYEQRASAEQHADYFASHGISVSSAARWATGNACYAHGWALGVLKYVPGDRIESAYLSGALRSEDILLTDGVPAEIPSLAGVISLSPSTPNSHVALLASSFGVPFVHMAVPADAERARDLVGRRTVLRADDDRGVCKVKLIDVQDALDPATIDAILALKQEPPLAITAVERFGAYSSPTTGLALQDIRFFGGKAVNSALLRRAIPAHSPLSTALSFDLWNDFLAQPLAGGPTLRQEIDRRLGGYAWPPDLASLQATLRGIQELIRDESRTTFDPPLRMAVLATLQDPQYAFDPQRNLRFRSSTNVEDAEQFIGAGLYDSFSGCLADELDSDLDGPSACDASESSERGVFRAIRKVFASFYNLNAYVERLRRRVNEAQVGMALLVHHSFPDSGELANGVATLEQESSRPRRIHLVSQSGADSVSNPIAGQIAEEVTLTVSESSGNVYVSYPMLRRPSNLVQLGATVMVHPGDYEALARLLALVADEYERTTGQAEFTLELEYKKLAPGNELVVKQVRRIPAEDAIPSVTPFLIGESVDYCLMNDEYTDVFTQHRLDSRWRIQTESLWLTPADLEQGIFRDFDVEYHDGCRIRHRAGSPNDWPQPTHEVVSQDAVAAVTEGWTFSDYGGRRRYRLTLGDIPLLVTPSQSPLLTLGDLGWDYVVGLAPKDSKDFGFLDFDGGCLGLGVSYDHPVPVWGRWPVIGLTTTTTDSARFCPCLAPSVGGIPWSLVLAGPDGVRIETTLGYTSRITGLTSTPIELETRYSQSFVVGHHAFSVELLFEPSLEPTLSPEQRAQLKAAGIRAIHVVHDPGYGISWFTYFDDEEWGGECPAVRERPAARRLLRDGPRHHAARLSRSTP